MGSAQTTNLILTTPLPYPGPLNNLSVFFCGQSLTLSRFKSTAKVHHLGARSFQGQNLFYHHVRSATSNQMSLNPKVCMCILTYELCLQSANQHCAFFEWYIAFLRSKYRTHALKGCIHYSKIMFLILRCPH